MSERRTDEATDAAAGGEAPGDVAPGEGAAGAGSRFRLAQALKPAAYALLAAAAVLIILGRPEAAFLAAGLGASAWFLHVRDALIRKHDLVKVGGRNWRPRREVERESAADDGDGEEEED